MTTSYEPKRAERGCPHPQRVDRDDRPKTAYRFLRAKPEQVASLNSLPDLQVGSLRLRTAALRFMAGEQVPKEQENLHRPSGGEKAPR